MISTTGKTHLAVTAIVVVSIAPPFSVPLAVGCIIGSFLPDADYPASIPGLFIPMWIVAKHRGRIHSWFMCLFFSVLAAAIDYRAGIGLFIGYALHLLLDSTTKMGLPMAMWPWKKNF